MKSARITGAILYGCAAAGAGVGALALSGDALDVKTVREVAPLAFVIGAMAGLGVVSHWPRRLGGAMLTGAFTALAVLVLFSAFYILGDAIIEAARNGGGGVSQTVAAAMGRLKERLPTAGPLAIGAFTLSGALLWIFAAIGRAARRRPRTQDA